MFDTQTKIGDLITEVHRWSHSGRVEKNRLKLAALIEKLNELALPNAVFGVDRFGDLHVVYSYAGKPQWWNPPYINTRVEAVWNYDPITFEISCVKSRNADYQGMRCVAPIPSLSVLL